MHRGCHGSRSDRDHRPRGDVDDRALMLEQNDEWAVCRHYMSLETLAGLSDDPAVGSKAIPAT